MIHQEDRGVRSAAPYRDRVDAGAALGEALQRYRGLSALVLGIPRGGVSTPSSTSSWRASSGRQATPSWRSAP
jgi:hypothetical protein